MPMRTKQCYLVTSPEKFQQQLGSGSSNTASPTPTGSRLPAILQPKNASSSQSGNQSGSPLDDIVAQMLEKEVTPESGSDDLPASGSSTVMDMDTSRFWETLRRKSQSS